MKIIKDNVRRLKNLKRKVVSVSLFAGGFAMPPFIGFNDGPTRYVIAWLSDDECQSMLKDSRQFDKALKTLGKRLKSLGEIANVNTMGQKTRRNREEDG